MARRPAHIPTPILLQFPLPPCWGCRGSLALGRWWGKARRGCDLRVDAPERWHLFRSKISTLSPRFTGHLLQDASAGLSRRKPGSVGAALFLARVPLCLLFRPGFPAQPHAPLGVVILGFIPTGAQLSGAQTLGVICSWSVCMGQVCAWALYASMGCVHSECA